MRKLGSGRRLATAAVIATAAFAAASPAQAHHHGGGNADRCEGGVERLEQRFREIEAKRGYDAATKWWEKAWAKYHDRCVV